MDMLVTKATTELPANTQHVLRVSRLVLHCFTCSPPHPPDVYRLLFALLAKVQNRAGCCRLQGGKEEGNEKRGLDWREKKEESVGQAEVVLRFF